MDSKNNKIVSVVTIVLFVIMFAGLLGGICFIISNLISSEDPVDPDDGEDTVYSITYAYEQSGDFTYNFEYGEDCPASSYPGFTVEFNFVISNGGRLSSVSAVRLDSGAELVSLTTSESFSAADYTFSYDGSFVMPESDVLVTIVIVSRLTDDDTGGSGGGDNDEEETCAHDYVGDDYVIAEYPTYTSTGSVYWECTLCGNKYYYTLAPTVYTNSGYLWTLTDTSATCTEDGEGVYEMSVSLQPYEDDRFLTADIVIVTDSPALGHIMSDPEVTVTPTFSAAGEAQSLCSRCGYVISYDLPVLSDSAYSVSNNTATCTESGTADYTIAINGYNITFEGESEALGHSYSSFTVSDLPTFSAEGTACRDCTRCDETETVSLPVLTDGSYTITNNTATAYADGTGIYSIEIDGETVSFTAATRRRSVDGVNPIFVNGYLNGFDENYLLDYETFTEAEDNLTVIGDGESAVLYFYANDGYYFQDVSAENCNVSYSFLNEYMAICVGISNVTGAITLNLSVGSNHKVTITGADYLDVVVEVGDDYSYTVDGSTSLPVTSSASLGGYVCFVFTGSEYYDKYPCTVTVTYVWRDGSRSYTTTVNSYYFRLYDADAEPVGVWEYCIRDESYTVTSGNTVSNVTVYVGYLYLFYTDADFDIYINVTTKSGEALYTMYENGVIYIAS